MPQLELLELTGWPRLEKGHEEWTKFWKERQGVVIHGGAKAGFPIGWLTALHLGYFLKPHAGPAPLTLLITSANSSSHYQGVLRKTGVPSAAWSSEKGSLVVLDSFVTASEQSAAWAAISEPDLSTLPRSGSLPQDGGLAGWTKVLELYMEAADAEGRPVVVVVEDMCAVDLMLGSSRTLSHYIRALIEAHSPGGAWIGVWPTAAGVRESDLSAVKASASLVLETRALASGWSRDVHGQLLVTTAPHQPGSTETNLHYKVLDNGVKLFRPGFMTG